MPRIRLLDETGTLREIKQIRLIDAGGTLRTISRVRILHTTGLKTVFGAMEASISPSPIAGISTVGGTGDVNTGLVTASVTNGTAPYSYSWSQVGSSPFTWLISAPTSASTYFTAQAVPEGSYATNDFQVAISDANGLVATAIVNATARNKYDVTIERDSSGRFL